ncbi:MAG: hypothetical protein Q8K70_05105 [Bacteroidota bacterium]|nr:hypothetical protein [Bacteroidota bacterium]
MHKNTLLITFFIIVLSSMFTSCIKNKQVEPTDQSDVKKPIVLNYNMSDIKELEFFNNYVDKGIIENKGIDEASGLAVSRSNPNRIWTHNDKGGANRLYIIGPNAESYGYFWIWGTGNRDWEDICIGPGPENGKNYLYVGDMGDNDAVYNQIIINRFIEPDISGLDSIGINRVDGSEVDRLIFVYPDGPRDAECLMIDPWTKDLYIVTKREARSSIYVARYPHSTTEVKTLEKIAEFPFNRALAGDISADGKEIVVKTDRRLYYWKREMGETILDALIRQPSLLPYFVEPQGEAFAWKPNADGYYTLSEKSGNVEPRLYYYSRK